MNHSWKLGTPFGISLRVHWTFTLLLLWILFSRINAGFAEATYALALVSALFACVTLHELGHALTARAYGIRTHGITLYPIGGVAELDRLPKDPRCELMITLAGPAVNFLLAGLLAPFYVLTPGVRILTDLFYANIALGVFNLLPAFPMDGGRILRSSLAMKYSHALATNVATRVAQALAVVLLIAGVVWLLPTVIIIAVFVFFAATAERFAAQHSQVPAFHGGVRSPGPQPARPFVVFRIRRQESDGRPMRNVTPRRR